MDRTKVDNYMMGNIMYYVLTTHWLFEGDTRDVAVDKLANHKRSHMPKKFRFSRDPAIRAIVGAIEDCWAQNPLRRPTSRKISNYLKRELGGIEKVNDLDIVRVSVPPLPVDFRHTDSDFVDNMGSPYLYDDEYNDEDHSSDDPNGAARGEDYEDEDNHNDHQDDAARGDAYYIDEDHSSGDPRDPAHGDDYDDEDHNIDHKTNATGADDYDDEDHSIDHQKNAAVGTLRLHGEYYVLVRIQIKFI